VNILISAHPEASGLFQRRAKGNLADPNACKAYAEAGRAWLATTLAQEANKR